MKGTSFHRAVATFSSLLFLPIAVSGLMRKRPLRVLASTCTSERRAASVSAMDYVGLLRGGGGGIGASSSQSSYHTDSNYGQNDGGMTLGDLERNGYATPSRNNGRPPKPILESVREYFAELHTVSPTLWFATASSVILFVLWQFPPSSFVANKLLRPHFVCDRINVVKNWRVHATLLSALSHASPTHLIMNLYALTKFGPSVRRTLARRGHDLPLWPFVVGAAAFSSAIFLLFDYAAGKVGGGGGGSCIGMSGVTLALLAFHATGNPWQELRTMVYFVPIRLPAYRLLQGLMALSVLGAFTQAFGGGAWAGNVAHSTHLGGLMFGVFFYEALSRGWIRSLRQRGRQYWYRR